MIEHEYISREVIYFVGSGVAAFLMALFRTVRFSDRGQQQFWMRLNEGFMCAMISSGLAVLMRTYFDTPFSWAIPIGVVVGFVGTNFIHVLIKSLIESQVGRYTGGQVTPDELKRKLAEIEAQKAQETMDTKAVKEKTEKKE